MDQLYPCFHKTYLTNCKIFKTANPAKYSEERWVSEAKLLLVMSFEYYTVAPSPSVDINTTPSPLVQYLCGFIFFLTALITFIGTVFWKPTYSYKKALGLTSQSMLAMPLVNCIPSPLPTVLLAYLHLCMYMLQVRIKFRLKVFFNFF